MNEVTSKILLGDIFMPEMHLKQPSLCKVFAEHSLKTKKEYKNLKKQEIQDLSIHNGILGF